MIIQHERSFNNCVKHEFWAFVNGKELNLSYYGVNKAYALRQFKAEIEEKKTNRLDAI